MFDQNCSYFYGCKVLTIYIISTRATAIMYMRRAGLSWGTIIKITGHRSVATVVKNYDLKLEAKGENWLSLDEVNRKMIVTDCECDPGLPLVTIIWTLFGIR
jgi:hypothetical protein